MRNGEIYVFMAGLVGGAMFLIFGLAMTNITPQTISEFPITPSDTATMIAGLGGAVVGALIAGIISWLLAMRTATEARRAEYDRETQRIKAGLLQVQVKTLNVSNGFYTMKVAIDAAVEQATRSGDQLWRHLRQSAGPHTGITFEVSDYIPLLHGKGPDLITDLNLLVERYQSAVAGYSAYSSLRAAFQEFSAPYTEEVSVGGTGYGKAYLSKYPPDAWKIAKMKMNELEGLIKQLKDYVDTDGEEAKKLTRKVNEFATQRIEERGDKFIKLQFVE